MAHEAILRRYAPVEPELELDDIQGIAVPGFFKPHQTLIGLRVAPGDEPARRFKELLRVLAGTVATGRATLADRRRFRKQRADRPTGFHRPPSMGVVLLAVAFTHRGLRRLTPGADAIPSEAFRSGLLARSALLGDPQSPGAVGHPSRWVVGKPGEELDALLIVAGDHRVRVDARVRALKKKIAANRVTIAYEENGDVLSGDLRGHEHFGFDDGVSQPGIRGRASAAPGDFVTDRHVHPRDVPAAWRYGYPGQDLVWPGEFVLGQPATSPDPLLPGPPSAAVPAWTRNGSFLVFRRLRQDVDLFWRTMGELADDLSAKPGFAGLTKAALAARLVGRWPSGAPFNRVPGADDAKLGKNRFASNYFIFDSDTPPIALADGRRDTFPPATADPVGIVCPWAAHIRKVNTRDSASDMGSRNATYDRRLLRVGIPYGEQITGAADAGDDRGLLFLSIQSSIENQFEFLTARWINDDARPKSPGGNDMLIGQNAAAPDGIRRCSLFGSGRQQELISTDRQWVVPTGGGYFFVPSLSAIRDVLAR